MITLNYPTCDRCNGPAQQVSDQAEAGQVRLTKFKCLGSCGITKVIRWEPATGQNRVFIHHEWYETGPVQAAA